MGPPPAWDTADVTSNGVTSYGARWRQRRRRRRRRRRG